MIYRASEEGEACLAPTGDTLMADELEDVGVDAIEQGIIGSRPPELFVMMNSAENGMIWEREHEVAGGELVEERLNKRF